MEYDNPNDRHVPIVATLGVLTAYILAGAFIFSITEEWTILNGNSNEYSNKILTYLDMMSNLLIFK